MSRRSLVTVSAIPAANQAESESPVTLAKSMTAIDESVGPAGADRSATAPPERPRASLPDTSTRVTGATKAIASPRHGLDELRTPRIVPQRVPQL